jgi:hypothetical protein
MEKYGVEDVAAQQRAELQAIQRELARLRGGFNIDLSLTKEASAELSRLEERVSALEQSLERTGGGGGARE